MHSRVFRVAQFSKQYRFADFRKLAVTLTQLKTLRRRFFGAFALAVALGVADSAHAGMSNVEVSCRSNDGLTLAGNVPGDLDSFEVTLTQGQKSERLFSGINEFTSDFEENATVTPLFDLQNKVWTLVIKKTGTSELGTLELHALPRTFRVSDTPNGYEAGFTGLLSYYLKAIGSVYRATVTCDLRYEI